MRQNFIPAHLSWPQVALFALLAFLTACESSRSATMPSKVLAWSAAPVTLSAGAFTTPLDRSDKPLAAHLDALPAGHSLYLIVRGLTAQRPPGAVYAVYLDLPADASDLAAHRIGDLNFFSARPPGAANAPDAESPTNVDREKVFYSFDVTAVARALRQRGQLSAKTTVTLIPEGTPDPASQAVVGRFELVEQ